MSPVAPVVAYSWPHTLHCASSRGVRRDRRERVLAPPAVAQLLLGRGVHRLLGSRRERAATCHGGALRAPLRGAAVDDGAGYSRGSGGGGRGGPALLGIALLRRALEIVEKRAQSRIWPFVTE